MLNRAERFRVLKLYRICCIVGLLPIEVDLVNWRLKVPWIGKRFIHFLFGIVLALHVIYKNGTLVYTYLFDQNVQHHQLVIHAVLAVASTMCVFWYQKLYICNPELLGNYLRTTLLGTVGGLSDHNEELEIHWTTRLREYSVQDLIALSVPCAITLGIPLVVATYIYDPSMRLLVYAALPTRLQTWTMFGLCTLEEVRLILVMISIAGPMWQLQVVSYDLASNQLQLLMRQIQNGMQTTRAVYKVLRSLQLYVSLANNVNSYLVFTWKLVSLAIAILAGYSAVAHFHEHPIFGVMYYMILFDVSLIYTIVYDKAFKIPQLFEQAAAQALLHRAGRRTGIFRRQIRSIPRTGIKVGHFHKMERASTLIFMNFVVTNIVSLLVAYG